MSTSVNSKMKKEDLIKILKAKEKERNMLFAKQTQNNKVLEELGWIAKKLNTLEQKIDQIEKRNLQESLQENERPKSPNPLMQSQCDLTPETLIPVETE